MPATTGINHPMFQLKAVYPVKGSAMWLLPFSDWLHQGFPFRNQFLNPKKPFDIGGFLAIPQHLPKNSHTEISNADLDYSNKQSFSGQRNAIEYVEYAKPVNSAVCVVTYCTTTMISLECELLVIVEVCIIVVVHAPTDPYKGITYRSGSKQAKAHVS